MPSKKKKTLVVCRRCYLAIAPILSFSFSPTQLIGLGHPVMCGASTATIPPGSGLSTYRSLAGAYYVEGTCQTGEGEVVEEGGEGKKERGLGGGNILTAHPYVRQ